MFAEIGAQACDCRRHDFSHHPRALTATKDKQILFWIRCRVARRGDSDDLRAHWIAGESYLALPVRVEVLENAEPGGNRRHTRRQESVGAPHDAVLLMQDSR